MRIHYHDLYEKQFEDLVIAICRNILGMAVQSFSTGPDGGRDARFVGTATKFINQSHVSGKFIIQAKHTEGIAEKFSAPDFASTSETSIISKEIERIKKLKKIGDIDYYILFSNRRLSGNINTTIEQRIIKETGIKTAHLVGIEMLDSYLKQYPDVYAAANINEFEMPLRVEPSNLAEIIIAFARNKKAFDISKEQEPLIERTKFDNKNKINNLSPEYALAIRGYLPYFKGVKDFLARPENSSILNSYCEVAEDFKFQIIARKSDFVSFDNVLNYLIKILFDRDYDLRKNKRLTRIILFYMYWNCDIGNEGKNA